MSHPVATTELPASPVFRRVAAAVGATLVALSVLAAAVRLGFVLWSGPFAATTGFEEFCLYNIWKAAHGLPVYEWPQRDTYLLSFYNGGFYHGFAAWCRAWSADGAGLVVASRVLTTLFGFAGLTLQAVCVQKLAPSLPHARLWAWGLAFVTWFGTGFVAWMPFSARPDVPAVAFALAGFLVAQRARTSGKLRGWLGASLLFFLAWSCKQSVVWTLAGVGLFAVWTRAGLRALLALTLPFLALAGISFLVGGETYRYNLMEVPRIFGWLPGQSVRLLAQAVALNLFFFVAAAFSLRALLSRASLLHSRAATDFRDTGVTALWFAAVPALVFGTGQLALRGSATNNVLEGFVLIATLASVAWLRALAQVSAPRLRVVGVIALASMLPLPAAQLVFAAGGETYPTVHGISLGNLTKLTPRQLAQRRHYAAWLDRQPKPLWLRDAMLQLPWLATADRYPAFVLNHQFETDARAKGVLAGEGFSEWIRSRHFATLVLDIDDPLATAARQAGYREEALPPEFASIPSEFGLDSITRRGVFRRAATPASTR